MKQLSKQVYQLRESQIRKFNDFARANDATVFLTLGQPDGETPEVIKKAAIDAIHSNKTKYGPSAGTVELREEISKFEKRVNQVDYSVEEIIVTCGSAEGIATVLFSILEKEDEVMVPTPAYPQYLELINYLQGKFVPIDTTTNNFELTQELLEANYSKKCKCLILNSPNNPTGHIYSDQSLDAVYQFAKEKGVFILCDDCYNQLVYEDRRLGFSKYQDIKKQIIVCQSFSKPYAMTGWRIGYLLADREILTQFYKMHQYLIVTENTFVQDGAIAALNYDVSDFVSAYKKKRDYAYSRLVDMGFEVKKPEGAFYLFPSIKKFHCNSWIFCEDLVLKKGLALVPGICFEADNNIRISYCVSMDKLKKGLDLLEEYLAENY